MDVAEGSVREFRNQSLIVVIGNICDTPYFPAKNPKRTAANPSNPCSSQFDLGFATSANFKALSVSSFSFSGGTSLGTLILTVHNLSQKGDGCIFYLLAPGLNLEALLLAMVFQGVDSEVPLFESLPFVAST